MSCSASRPENRNAACAPCSRVTDCSITSSPSRPPTMRHRSPIPAWCCGDARGRRRGARHRRGRRHGLRHRDGARGRSGRDRRDMGLSFARGARSGRRTRCSTTSPRSNRRSTNCGHYDAQKCVQVAPQFRHCAVHALTFDTQVARHNLAESGDIGKISIAFGPRFGNPIRCGCECHGYRAFRSRSRMRAAQG